MSPLQGLVVAGALIAVLAGCGLVGGPSAEDQHRDRWQEGKPSTYSFVLDATCGERALIGRFAVTVRGTEVTRVEGLDQQGRALVKVRSDLVPSLDGLLAELDDARHRDADVARATFDEGDGHLTTLQIDYDKNATDDEACYLVTAYSR